jgi:nucleotide-binding universal stress UspA family protein
VGQPPVDPRAEHPAGLRILLAHDLSPAADRATALLAGATWPAGTVVAVVSATAGIGSGLSSFALLSEARAHARQIRESIAWTHERVTEELRASGLAVETRIVHGRPERALVAAAERFGAHVVVVGAREQGGVSATLLGSVSRSVVEGAPCSVLVARAATVSRVVLATDGTEPARLATSILASWPLFAGVRTLVLGVAPGPSRYPELAREDPGAPGGSLQEADVVAHLAEVVAAAVADLGRPGRTVEQEIRLGSAGSEVVAAAQAVDADLVAIGAHGQPLLRRLLLGSVARQVLDGVHASVLVARPRA